MIFFLSTILGAAPLAIRPRSEWEISFWRLASLGTVTVLGLTPIMMSLRRSLWTEILQNVCLYILNTYAKFHWKWVKNDWFRSRKVIFGVYGPFYDVIKGVNSGQKTPKCVFFVFITLLLSLVEIGWKMTNLGQKTDFRVFWTPLWRHRGVWFGSKYTKMCVFIF